MVVLPTDMPFVDAELLRALRGRRRGRTTPPSRRPARSRARTGARRCPCSSGGSPRAISRSMRALSELGTRVLQWDEAALRNVNEPGDL